MIRLLHGDNISGLTKRLSELEQEYKTISRFDSKKENAGKIVESLFSEALFAEKRLVILTNFHLMAKKDEEALFDFLLKNKEFLPDLICVSEIQYKKQFPKELGVLHEEFMLPKFFFLFLDSLIPGNASQVLDYLKRIGGSQDDLQLFYACVKRIRQLIIVKSANVSEPVMKSEGLQGWQIGRLQSQSSRWSIQELVEMYEKLYSLEKDIKTSGDALSVGKRLDIIISTALN